MMMYMAGAVSDPEETQPGTALPETSVPLLLNSRYL